MSFLKQKKENKIMNITPINVQPSSIKTIRNINFKSDTKTSEFSSENNVPEKISNKTSEIIKKVLVFLSIALNVLSKLISNIQKNIQEHLDQKQEVKAPVEQNSKSTDTNATSDTNNKTQTAPIEPKDEIKNEPEDESKDKIISETSNNQQSDIEKDETINIDTESPEPKTQNEEPEQPQVKENNSEDFSLDETAFQRPKKDEAAVSAELAAQIKEIYENKNLSDLNKQETIEITQSNADLPENRQYLEVSEILKDEGEDLYDLFDEKLRNSATISRNPFKRVFLSEKDELSFDIDPLFNVSYAYFKDGQTEYKINFTPNGILDITKSSRNEKIKFNYRNAKLKECAINKFKADDCLNEGGYCFIYPNDDSIIVKKFQKMLNL